MALVMPNQQQQDLAAGTEQEEEQDQGEGEEARTQQSQSTSDTQVNSRRASAAGRAGGRAAHVQGQDEEATPGRVQAGLVGSYAGVPIPEGATATGSAPAPAQAARAAA
jgi:hypothetical protein